MKNLLYLLSTWASLFVFNTHAQKRDSSHNYLEDDKTIKQYECNTFNQNYFDDRELYIRFNQNGQLIGGMPSILRKGDKIFFAIEGKDFTNSRLQKTIKEYKDELVKINYENLSIESRLLFPDSTTFEEYKKNIGTYLPKIDTITINTIYQLTVQYRVKDGYLKSASPKFNITKLPCNSVAISDVFVVPCELAADQIGFTLTRQNIDNILMANYLKENKDCYGQWGQYAPNFDKVKNDFIKKAKVIEDSLRAFDYSILMGSVTDSLPSENLQKLMKDTNNIISIDTYLEKALLNVPENKEWMKKWLWLTGLNTPAMNPFDKIKIDNNGILNIDKELTATQRRIDAIGLVIKNSQLTDNNGKVIKQYLDELDTLQQKVVELTDKKKDLTTRKEAYEKWLIEREIRSNLLYAGTLFVSEAEQINWMPHYDALNNYRLSNAPNSIPGVVANIDAVHPLVFNLRHGTKAFAEETVTPFPLTTPITDAFNAWGGMFDGIVGIVKTEKKKLEFEKKKLEFDEAVAKTKWLNAQTAPPLQINLKPSTDTLYHTDWAEAKEIKEKKGAVKIGYDLSVSDGKTATKVVKNASYKQYDLPRFWYGVGLAYIPKPRYTSVYDETKGLFINNAEPQQLDIVVGTKIYPFRPMNQMRTCKLARYTHYGRRYNQLRGNGHINRLSVFVGLGVRYKFLRNYFVGLGYDIIPGINVNAGYNFYFKRTYEIENGKLLNSYERLASGGVYYSITTDVEVFKRLVQLINPF